MHEITAEDFKKNAKKTSGNGARIYGAETDVVETLKKLESKIDFIHSSLDNVTDPDLIDSYVFELKAVHMRYGYYMKLCKNLGIIGHAG